MCTQARVYHVYFESPNMYILIQVCLNSTCIPLSELSKEQKCPDCNGNGVSGLDIG